MADSPSDEAHGGGAGETVEMPMFPLGSVLLPGGVLPLHIFEIRYQQLLNTVLETDRRFGVVLISRGSEVGGGEHRTDIGTIAHVDEHQRFDDGRAAVVSSGTARLQVVEWLDDDPYPRAMVRELAVEPDTAADRLLLAAAQQRLQQRDALTLLIRGQHAYIHRVEQCRHRVAGDPAGERDPLLQMLQCHRGFDPTAVKTIPDKHGVQLGEAPGQCGEVRDDIEVTLQRIEAG